MELPSIKPGLKYMYIYDYYHHKVIFGFKCTALLAGKHDFYENS